MNSVVNFADWRVPHDIASVLEHPAGVTIPMDDPVVAEIITPSIHAEIAEGSYCAEMIAGIPHAIRGSDRVLLIGTGLGILSTLVSRMPGVSEVIAIEMDSRLISVVNRVHARNGVRNVQVLNGIPTTGRRGGVPVFARSDPRTSSPLPDDGPWDQALLVPFVDLGLILADEQISSLVCDVPQCAAQMIAEVDLHPAERILMNAGGRSLRFWQDGEPGSLLKAQGFEAECTGSAIVASRCTARQFRNVG